MSHHLLSLIWMSYMIPWWQALCEKTHVDALKILTDDATEKRGICTQVLFPEETLVLSSDIFSYAEN